MADTLKVLGQQIPASGTLTALYTVPASTTTTASTFAACNQSAVATTFRMSVAVAGAADTPKQYVYFDIPLSGNDTFAATLGLTLGATDVVRCLSGNGQVSFLLFGVEVT